MIGLRFNKSSKCLITISCQKERSKYWGIIIFCPILIILNKNRRSCRAKLRIINTKGRLSIDLIPSSKMQSRKISKPGSINIEMNAASLVLTNYDKNTSKTTYTTLPNSRSTSHNGSNKPNKRSNTWANPLSPN